MPEEPADARGWMARCLELAAEARSRGDAPVGAVVTRAGRAIAEAREQVRELGDPAAHAELLAIRAACRALGSMDLSGCTLFTNVEPCWMCSFALREARVGTVVVGSPVGAIGGITSRHPLLTADVEGWGAPPTIIWRGATGERPG